MIAGLNNIVRKFKLALRLLIHSSVRGNAIERIRHRLFITSHLASAVLAVAAFPVYLIVVGTNDFVGMLIFLGLIFPGYIAIFLSRTGKLALAHLFSAINLTTLVTFTAVFTGGVTSFIVAWILVVPVESAFSGSKKVIAASLVLACASVVFLVYAGSIDLLPPARTRNQDNMMLMALSIISAVAYISGLVVNTQVLNEKAAALIQYSQRHFRLLAENATDMITYHDHRGAVIFSSGASNRFASKGASDLIGGGFIKHIHPDDRGIYLETFSNASASTKPAHAEFRIKSNLSAATNAQTQVDKDDYIWVEMRCQTLSEGGISVEDEEGSKLARIVAVTRDISEIKAQQEEIIKSRDLAQEASRAKSRFLANIGHELRTPLNAIIGFSDILGNEKLSPGVEANQRDYIRLIHQSGSHLLLVVNDMLDMAKIEAGKMNISPEVFDFADLIAASVRIMQVTADQRNIKIFQDLRERPCEVTADKRALNQILFNLISNAVKFSHQDGEIRVSLDASNEEIKLVVADEGIGIPLELISNLCQPFVQADNSLSRAYEGTGLGLSVVKGFVELHHGSLHISSEDARGTRVSVNLPRHYSSGEVNPPAELERDPDQPVSQTLETVSCALQGSTKKVV